MPVVLTLGFSFGAAVFEGFSVGMLIPFLQTFTEDGETFQTGVRWIDTHLLGAEASKIVRMYRICGLILVATLSRSALSYLSSVYMVVSRARIVQDLRQRVADRLTEVALAYYATTRTGEIMNSVTNEISRTINALTALFGFVRTGALMLMYGTLMFWISWKLSLMALTAFLVLSLALNSLLSRIRSSGEEITSANANFADRISEFISGVRTATAYNMRNTERERIHQAAKRAADAGIHANKQSQIIQPLSKAVIGTVLILLVVVAMQYFVLEGALSMAFLLTFLFALFRLMPKVHAMNHQRGLWARSNAGLANVAELIRPADKPHLEDGTRTAPPLADAISFDDVSFAYQPDTPILEGINLRIEKGKTTALVGATGAGKSTLVDLIPRFYDPTEGRVLYDGTDLRDFDVSSLRSRIAIVSQSTHVFNDTVRSNIAYGVSEPHPEEVRWAAEQANALEFIEEMEEGFQTMLGEDGVRVSGGQRQRIAIARALLQDPDILILDEATSDLDSVTEQLVQEGLERLMRDRTVVAIAHRLSTIEHADKVAVLENGEVVEQGSYEELIDRRGQLWQYHQAQYQKREKLSVGTQG
jgi:subfamily B ATP-binding cassette protein MsbA